MPRSSALLLATASTLLTAACPRDTAIQSVRPKARPCSVNHRGFPRRRQSRVPRSSLLYCWLCCVCVEKTNATGQKIPLQNACTQCPHSANAPSVFKATRPPDSPTSARLEARTVSPFASAKGPFIVPAVPCAHTLQPQSLSTYLSKCLSI